MNELPPSSNSEPLSTPAPAVASGPQAKPPFRLQRTTIALIVLALLLAGQWWNTRNQLRNLRDQMAQRLQQADTINNETRLLAKTVQETGKEVQAKVNVLESKQAEAQSQQLALEQLYQELSRNRDDWALAEIEQVLSTASQQLQLAGNVPGALIALQNADRSLSRSDKPQFITIRRAIARDQERLKSLPQLDVNGVAVRLDSVINQIDSMPLLADEKPVVPVTQPKQARPAKAARTADAASQQVAATDWSGGLRDKWDSWSSEMGQELRQLIRVRQVDTPEALLLSPTQAYYARENLKLRLLNARLALLSRNESAFRSDMISAQDTIARYFDTRAKQTQTAQTLLKQVQNSNLSIELPTLADSLNAVRNYKAKP